MKPTLAFSMSTLLLAGCLLSTDLPPDVVTGDELPTRQETSGSFGKDRDPEVSPDGEWIFYASSSQASHFDIFRKRLDLNTVVRVTRAPSNERFPRLNPRNHKMLAFASDITGEWNIYFTQNLNLDPDKWVRVSDPGSTDIHPSWSSNGQLIAYSSQVGGKNGPWLIKIYDLIEETTTILPEIQGLLPEWSPIEGDNRMVFQRMRERDNWYGTIWMCRYRLGKMWDLTAIYEGQDWAAINPSWSPEGTQIVFSTVAHRPSRKQITQEADDIWVINEDGSMPRQLTTHPASDWLPTWAPNGRIYFLSKRRGSERIWSMKMPSIKKAE